MIAARCSLFPISIIPSLRDGPTMEPCKNGRFMERSCADPVQPHLLVHDQGGKLVGPAGNGATLETGFGGLIVLDDRLSEGEPADGRR